MSSPPCVRGLLVAVVCCCLVPTLSEEMLAMLSPEARAALDAHRAGQAAAAAALAAAQADGDTEIGEDFGMSQVRSTHAHSDAEQ